MSTILTAICILFLVQKIQAQEIPNSEPTKEHEFLKKFVGQWEVKSKGSAGEGQDAVVMTGTMDSKMFGRFWLVNNCSYDMNGTPMMKAVQTLGYDPEKKKYIGTWIDTMMNKMWIYEGTVNDAGTKIVLEADGPHMTEPGKTMKFRDAFEFKSDDEIIATSMFQGDDGEWTMMMTGTATRKK